MMKLRDFAWRLRVGLKRLATGARLGDMSRALMRMPTLFRPESFILHCRMQLPPETHAGPLPDCPGMPQPCSGCLLAAARQGDLPLLYGTSLKTERQSAHSSALAPEKFTPRPSFSLPSKLDPRLQQQWLPTTRTGFSAVDIENVGPLPKL